MAYILFVQLLFGHCWTPTAWTLLRHLWFRHQWIALDTYGLETVAISIVQTLCGPSSPIGSRGVCFGGSRVFCDLLDVRDLQELRGYCRATSYCLWFRPQLLHLHGEALAAIRDPVLGIAAAVLQQPELLRFASSRTVHCACVRDELVALREQLYRCCRHEAHLRAGLADLAGAPGGVALNNRVLREGFIIRWSCEGRSALVNSTWRGQVFLCVRRIYH